MEEEKETIDKLKAYAKKIEAAKMREASLEGEERTLKKHVERYLRKWKTHSIDKALKRMKQKKSKLEQQLKVEMRQLEKEFNKFEEE